MFKKKRGTPIDDASPLFRLTVPEGRCTTCDTSAAISSLVGRVLSFQLPARSIAALARGVRLLGLALVVDDGQVLAAHLLGLLVDGALGYAAFTARLCRLLLKGRKKA